MKKVIITSLVLLFTLTLNAQWWGNSKKIKGNGNISTETRKTQEYNSVSLGGSFDVVLVQGKEGNLKIEGEENLLPYIITEVKNDGLKIYVKKGINIKTTRKLLVRVPIQDIQKISLGGSGNIKSETLLKAEELILSIGGSGNIDVDIDATTIKSSVAGSGDINLKGKTDFIECSIAGSGSVKGFDLQANKLKASIAGSGSIKINVKDEITTSIAGSGNVYYKGNPPKINSKSAGSGSIVRKD